MLSGDPSRATPGGVPSPVNAMAALMGQVVEGSVTVRAVPCRAPAIRGTARVAPASDVLTRER